MINPPINKRTKKSLEKIEQIKNIDKSLLNDSLFLNKREKESILEQLKKGSLFKWSSHLKQDTKRK